MTPTQRAVRWATRPAVDLVRGACRALQGPGTARHAPAEAVEASELLSGISHELRTPLTTIIGFAQLLEEEDLPPDQMEYVHHIVRAGHHMLSLVDGMADHHRWQEPDGARELPRVMPHG